jgi:hypothetical protein
MELIGVGPGGEFRDKVELLKERGHHLTGIIALAELVELPEQRGQRVFDLGNRNFRVILSLTFETSVVFQELFAEKIGQAPTGRRMERAGLPQSVGRGQLALQVHFGVGLPSSLEVGACSVND